MINIIQSCTCKGIRRALSDPARGLADDCIIQADKYIEPAAAGSGKRSGIWWIDRVLILLAVMLFIMTVTAQLYIYLKRL